MHDEQSLLPQRLMRPDLHGEREAVLDLLGESGHLADFALVEVLEVE